VHLTWFYQRLWSYGTTVLYKCIITIIIITIIIITILAIFMPKIIKVGGNLTKLWQKQCWLFFFETQCTCVLTGWLLPWIQWQAMAALRRAPCHSSSEIRRRASTCCHTRLRPLHTSCSELQSLQASPEYSNTIHQCSALMPPQYIIWPAISNNQSKKTV